MKIKHCAGLLLAALATGAWSEQHRPLLPEPKSVQYGQFHLQLSGLTIEVQPQAAPQDRFAATTLEDGIANQTGVKLPIATTGEHGMAITLDRTGSVDALPAPGETPGPESREAYALSITPKGVKITGRSSASVFYGVQTLLQMIEGRGESAYLPEVEIRDWPTTAYRATLVDVAGEGPMTTVKEIERQIDFLAKWKGNLYCLYVESNIELSGYPLLNPDAHYTKSEIREIIDYAAARHIDVVPSVELYGHLHDLFRTEKYSDLADFPHGGEFNPSNPKVKVLLDDWIAQLTELFPSHYFFVGFDETWAIQEAADKAGAGATPVQLFIDQLSYVTDALQRRNKTVMPFADIMVKFPGIISRLPKGLIAIPWCYSADPDPEYKYWLNPLAEQHVPMMVASGVNSWVEITPNYDVSFENIDTLLAAGRRANTLGLINTLWTDDDQVLLRMSWPGIAYGAIAPWQSEPVDRSRFFLQYSQIVYPSAAAEHLAEAFSSLKSAEVAFETAAGRASNIEVWKDPFEPAMLARMAAERESLRQTRLLAETAEEHLLRAQSLGVPSDQLADLLVGARLLDYAGMKFIYALEINDRWAALPAHPTRDQVRDAFRFGIYNATHSRVFDLMDGITQLRPRYRDAWLSQYTDYRLGTALGRWDAEYEYWRRAQSGFEEFVSQFHDGESLPSLGSVVHGSTAR